MTLHRYLSYFIRNLSSFTSQLANLINNSESKTVVNTFADNAFKHHIILSDKTVSPITLTPYVFNSSNNSQYNDTEFKVLLIDSRV